MNQLTCSSAMRICGVVVLMTVTAGVRSATAQSVVGGGVETEAIKTAEPSTFERIASATPEQRQAAADLLAEIYKQPGEWSQMCFMPRYPGDDTFDLYGFIPSNYRITPGNFLKLRAMREPVIAVLLDEVKAEIAALEEHRKAMAKPPTGSPIRVPESGSDSEALLGSARFVEYEGEHPLGDYERRLQKLSVLVDLNAIEAIGSLKTLMRTQYALRERHLRMTMTAMATIIRQEQYQPLLESNIERTYRKAAADELKRFYPPKDGENGNAAPRDFTADDIPESQRSAYQFDPVLQQRMSAYAITHAPINDRTVKLLGDWADDLECCGTKHKHRLAAGMSAWPVTR